MHLRTCARRRIWYFPKREYQAKFYDGRNILGAIPIQCCYTKLTYFKRVEVVECASIKQPSSLLMSRRGTTNCALQWRANGRIEARHRDINRLNSTAFAERRSWYNSPTLRRADGCAWSQKSRRCVLSKTPVQVLPRGKSCHAPLSRARQQSRGSVPPAQYTYTDLQRTAPRAWG